MAINFPNSPINGQIFTDPTSGISYIYNNTYQVWQTREFSITYAAWNQANAAYNQANAASTHAAAAFNKANAVATHAAAAFDKANTDVTSISITPTYVGNTSYVPTITVAANGRVTAVTSNVVTTSFSISNDISSAFEKYVILTSSTSGSITGGNITVTGGNRLAFQPSIGQLSAITFNQLSDIKFKTNLEPITDAVNIVKLLNGYSYDMLNMPEGTPRYFGFIAQEVEPILPNVVTQSSSGKGLNYTMFIPILAEAIKALSTKIDDLELRIQQVENNVV